MTRSALRRLTISRDFALLWFAQAASSFGEFALATTLTVWFIEDLAAGEAWLPTAIAALVAAAAVPRIVVAPLAGAWVDRRRPKAVLWFSDLTRAAVVTLVAVVLVVAQVPSGLAITVLVVMVAVNGVLAQFFNPARAALVQAVLDPEQRVAAASRSTFSLNGVAIIAAAVGPIMYVAVGPYWSLAINALTYVTSAAFILFLRDREVVASSPERKRYFADLADGIKLAWKTAELRLILVGVAIYGVSLGVNNTVLALFALRTIMLSPVEYGFVAASFAAGALAGAPLVPLVTHRLGVERAFAVSLGMLGVAYLLYSFARDFWPALILMFLAGVTFATFATAQGPLQQAATPPGFMGRVSSLSAPVMSITSTLASLACGALLVPLVAVAGDGAYGWAIFVASIALLVGGGVMVAGVAQRKREPAD